MGLYVSADEGERVYLRAWQDFDHHTLYLRSQIHPALNRSVGV